MAHTNFQNFSQPKKPQSDEISYSFVSSDGDVSLKKLDDEELEEPLRVSLSLASNEYHPICNYGSLLASYNAKRVCAAKLYRQPPAVHRPSRDESGEHSPDVFGLAMLRAHGGSIARAMHSCG